MAASIAIELTKRPIGDICCLRFARTKQPRAVSQNYPMLMLNGIELKFSCSYCLRGMSVSQLHHLLATDQRSAAATQICSRKRSIAFAAELRGPAT